jgi:hypothetical protein
VVEKRYVLGAIEKAHQARTRLQQTNWWLTDGNTPLLRRDLRFREFLTIKNLPHNRHIETN